MKGTPAELKSTHSHGAGWRTAHRDKLTALPNRMRFNERLSSLARRAIAKGETFAAGIIDLDGFTAINDLFGHDEGDALLAQVARRLARAVEPYGTLARLGADEFAVLITSSADLPSLRRPAEALLTAMHEPFICGEAARPCTMSLGFALFPRDAATPSDLLKSADLALYRAKKRGGNRYEVYDKGLSTAIETRNRFHRQVEASLAAEEFRLHYQPIVSLSEPGKVSLEALLRWDHPQRGLLAPAAFEELFADARIASKIGKWVIDRALSDASVWRRDCPGFNRVAVNVTSADFAVGGLAAFVEGKLAEHGVEPARLCVEVTERVFLGHGATHVAESLARLHELGVEIALDDFGTGYASLAHVTKFPVGRLKVDRSFVRDMEARSSDMAIVLSIIELAGALGIDVTAEGVDSEGQLALLKGMGCGSVQGYLFSQPLEAVNVPTYIASMTQ